MKKELKALKAPEQTMSFNEFSKLLWINFTVAVKGLFEFFKVATRYYGNIQFLKEDLSLRLMYFFHNPFAISKRFLMKKGEADIYTYGETPLTTLEVIAKESGIKKEDCYVELGSARGRNCFWINSFIGCPTVGIEYIPEFVERAKLIAKKLNVKGVEFIVEDFLKEGVSFPSGTVFYLYGTCLTPEQIEKLAKKFAKLPAGTKIISVSYSLSDYYNQPSFEVIKHFRIPFTWGEGDVYIQIVK